MEEETDAVQHHESPEDDTEQGVNQGVTDASPAEQEEEGVEQNQDLGSEQDDDSESQNPCGVENGTGASADQSEEDITKDSNVPDPEEKSSLDDLEPSVQDMSLAQAEEEEGGSEVGKEEQEIPEKQLLDSTPCEEQSPETDAREASVAHDEAESEHGNGLSPESEEKVEDESPQQEVEESEAPCEDEVKDAEPASDRTIEENGKEEDTEPVNSEGDVTAGDGEEQIQTKEAEDEPAAPEPKAPEKKQPRFRFGGGPECGVCNKAVFFNEEKRAIGKVFHKTCFKCSLCSKTLNSMNCNEHGNDLFCKVCHSKSFGPKGYGFGQGAGTLNMDRGELVSPTSSTTSIPGSGKSQVTNKDDPECCPRCGTKVYFAEQLLSLGRKWHKLCFRCANCGKGVDSTSIADHQGELYCKACYMKLFGTSGYGRGTMSLGTGVPVNASSED